MVLPENTTLALTLTIDFVLASSGYSETVVQDIYHTAIASHNANDTNDTNDTNSTNNNATTPRLASPPRLYSASAPQLTECCHSNRTKAQERDWPM